MSTTLVTSQGRRTVIEPPRRRLITVTDPNSRELITQRVRPPAVIVDEGGHKTQFNGALSGGAGEKGDKGEPGRDGGDSVDAVFQEPAFAGQVVFLSKVNGRARLASAEQLVTSFAIGLVVDDAQTDFVHTIQMNGPVRMLDWTKVAGTPTLKEGERYFLALVPGMISVVAPEARGYAVTVVGKATDAITLAVKIEEPTLL